jgi:hypothetical protein
MKNRYHGAYFFLHYIRKKYTLQILVSFIKDKEGKTKESQNEGDLSLSAHDLPLGVIRYFLL